MGGFFVCTLYNNKNTGVMEEVDRSMMLVRDVFSGIYEVH